MTKREPEVQDIVRHKYRTDFSGRVLAKYQCAEYDNLYYGQQLLDVAISDTNVYYGTPMDKWETISTEVERIGGTDD